MAVSPEDPQRTIDELTRRLAAATAPPVAVAAPPVAHPALAVPPAPAVMGMQFGQAAPVVPEPTGVSIQLSIPLGDGGDVPVQLHYGPEAVGDLQGLIRQLGNAGWPLRIFYPKRQGFGGGGFNPGGGGYQQGGYRR